jgi:hypothetical protein
MGGDDRAGNTWMGLMLMDALLLTVSNTVKGAR